MLPSLLLLGFAFEGFQPRIPEALEELLELREALGPHAVQASRAVPSLAHEPRLLEDDSDAGRPPGRETSKCDAISPALISLVADERENLPPPRCGDRLQRSLHGSM